MLKDMIPDVLDYYGELDKTTYTEDDFYKQPEEGFIDYNVAIPCINLYISKAKKNYE